MIFLILFGLIWPTPVFALDPIIKISNFSSNSSPEWVEINNTSENIISINNWLIKDANDTSTDDLILSGCLSPFSYQTFYHPSGWLNDSGDTINLYDNLNNSIDKLIYTKGKLDLTPRATNSCTPSPLPTATPFVSPEPTAEAENPSPTPTLFNNPLILSEIMANPETNQNEWIEIYNPSNQKISLKNICFYDASSHSRCFPDDATIFPTSYSTHSFSSGFLNNDGDTVTFQNVSVIYPKSSKNITYSRQKNNSWCFAKSSQDLDNNDCASVTTSNSSETNYVLPLLTLQSIPNSVNAGDDFNLVFSLNSADPYSLRLIFPFGSQYFPFSNFKDGYSWLILPLSVPKKLPEGNYPLSFHLKKTGSNHLFDYQQGELNIKTAIVTPKISKSKILGSSTSCPQCLDNSASVNYYPASTLNTVNPDVNFFSWPFLFAGSILFLSPILFPKLYSV